MTIRYSLTIEGMHCGACVRRVQHALTEAGATAVTVTVGKAEATVDDVPEAELRRAVEDLGFPVSGVAAIAGDA
jgi:copper chaperone CopZ